LPQCINGGSHNSSATEQTISMTFIVNRVV